MGEPQALAHTVLLYSKVGATGSLILLFSLFNRRRWTLHDVLNRDADAAPP